MISSEKIVPNANPVTPTLREGNRRCNINCNYKKETCFGQDVLSFLLCKCFQLKQTYLELDFVSHFLNSSLIEFISIYICIDSKLINECK